MTGNNLDGVKLLVSGAAPIMKISMRQEGMNCLECKDRLSPDNPEVGKYLLRTGQYFVPLCQGCPNEYDKGIEESLNEVRSQIANLEAISAQPGEIPWQYQNSLTQLQGQVTFLQNKLNAALDRGKQKAKQQAAQKQSVKPTYKGLNA